MDLRHALETGAGDVETHHLGGEHLRRHARLLLRRGKSVAKLQNLIQFNPRIASCGFLPKM